MRLPVLAALASCLVPACGGAVDATAASTPPNADAGAVDSAVDAPEPDDAAPDAAPSCAPDGGFVGATKACHGDDECAAALHTVDCCGTKEWVGVAKADSAAWASCESAWVSSLPACGCDSNQTTAEDGANVVDPATVTVECTYWTMSGGVCMTRVSAGDAGTDGGAYAGIACGASICTSGAMCCVSGSAPVEQCVPTDGVGPKCDFSATCDGPEDCAPGESCCGPSGAKMQSYCAAGACPAGDTLCHTSTDCADAASACCPAYEFGWTHSVCANGAACP